MARRGKLVLPQRRKRRVFYNEDDSDDSDEDYVLGEDEENEISDSSECASPSAGEELVDTFDFEAISGSSREEEEEREVIGLKPRRVIRGQREQSLKRSRKRINRSDYDEIDYDYNDEEFIPYRIDHVDGREKRAVGSNPIKGSFDCSKRTRASVDFDGGNSDYNDDDEENGEEFTPDGVDLVDDQVRKMSIRRKRLVRKSNPIKGSSDCIKHLRKRTRASFDFDDGNGNYDDGDDDDDDDDEEFIPDGVDFEDDDEDFQVREKHNERKHLLRKSNPVKVSSDCIKHLRKRTRAAVDFDDGSGEYNDDEDFQVREKSNRRKHLVRNSNPIKGSSNCIKQSRKRTRASVSFDGGNDDYNDDDGDEEFTPDGVDFVDDYEDFHVREKSNTRKHLVRKSNPVKGSSDSIKHSRKRIIASIDLADGSGDYDDDDDDNDKEFTLDGIDFVDDDEDFEVREKSNNRKHLVRKKVSLKGQKRKRKSKAAKKPLRKKRRMKRKSVLRRLVSSDDDFLPENRTVKRKSKKKPGRRNKRSILYSDSDIECYGSSDFECTISEEEREVLREASIFCRNLTTCLRSSSLSKQPHVDGDGTLNHYQKFRTGRKGKEKVEDLQIDAEKQVCGICLSEEGKGTVQGTLNCCNHYFCFACILEWSRVESRCPLCKQRFAIISKLARSNIGNDLRSVIIQVPKRDQVYRPSEEEVRGYFDPYENVVCIECQQGGDDNLMLLCDICDSPAHTYCVGLGREVPEGNWYCEGCRPADPGSSNSIVQDIMVNEMTVSSNLTAGLSTREINVESSDCTYQNSLSVQSPSVSPGIGVVPPPRHTSGRDWHATSTLTGAGASTLSGRRRIHHRMHSLLSSNRMNEGAEMAGRTDEASQVNFGSKFGNCKFELGGETTHRDALTSQSAKSCFAVGCMAQNSTPCPTQEEDAFGASFRHLGRHINEGPSTATLCVSSCGALCAEHAEVNAISIPGQLHQGPSMPINGTDANISHNSLSNEAHFHRSNAAEEQKGAKRKLKSIVGHHLRRLSQHRIRLMSLRRQGEHGMINDPHCQCALEVPDRGTFKDIARHSICAILAACGLDHKRNMAIPWEPPTRCPHVERLSEPINQMENCCSSCINSFVCDVVRRVMDMRLQSVGFNR